MYLKPKISPESTKYVEAEHEKEEGDNRKAENINQPLIGLYIFRSSCICQVFLLMLHLISISLWRKKQDLPKIEVGHYGWQRTPVTREINVHQTLKIARVLFQNHFVAFLSLSLASGVGL